MSPNGTKRMWRDCGEFRAYPRLFIPNVTNLNEFRNRIGSRGGQPMQPMHQPMQVNTMKSHALHRLHRLHRQFKATCKEIAVQCLGVWVKPPMQPYAAYAAVTRP